MRTLAYSAFYLGSGLLLVAIVQLAGAAWRRRDSQRLDSLLFMSLLVGAVFMRGGSPSDPTFTLRMILVRLTPWALVRLVSHFRGVPRWVSPAFVGIAFAGPIFAGASSGSLNFTVRTTDAAILGLTASAVALVLAIEARRSAGTKRPRVWFAAAGTAAIGVAALIGFSSLWSTEGSRAGVDPMRLFVGVACVCFYFAFATPRPLLTRWRKAEQSNYLSHAMKRDPEDRGQHAAEDLFNAAVRGVGGAVTFVAMRDEAASAGLRVVAASDPALEGHAIAPAGGLIGSAVTTARAHAGGHGDCERDLGDNVLMQGGGVLVAPIVTEATSHVWGVVVVAQRRGALFPEDDLEMLTQVAGNAANALDHHQLIVARRVQARRAADQRLQEIESRVDLMLDSIKDYAMLVLEDDGRIAAWHLGAEYVFGHPRAQIAGTSAAAIYDMSSAEFTAWLQDARLHGRAEREGLCRRADGTTFVGTTMIRPLVVEAGAQAGFVVVTHDVTDRRDMEDRLRQGQKMEAIGQLAGGVAHDFNNLLTAILGYSDWLDRDLAGDPRRVQVTEIQKAAERAADLTRQLLAFSRRQTLRPAALDLSELASDMVPMLRRIIGEQIDIVEDAPRGLPAIMADRSQVEQIILNLAVNARDAMPDGGQLVIRADETWLNEGENVLSSGLPPGPYALLEVTDRGTGMDAETRRRVFEPFFTTKEVGRGTGLGLSTVYGIVQQMGGAIELDTELGRGTTFRLYFPQAAAAAPEAPAHASTRALARGSETVLLVEDDPDVRMYLTRVLESQGYCVLAAEHARAALALAESTAARIDLVISDIVMPGGTGPELVKLLGRAQPDLSALFISGHGAGVLARHVGAVHGTPLLHKPFSSKDLLTKVRQILSAA